MAAAQCALGWWPTRGWCLGGFLCALTMAGAHLLGHELRDFTRRRLSPHPAANLGLGFGFRVRVRVGGVRAGVGIRVS